MAPIAEFPKPTVIPPHVWVICYETPTPAEVDPLCFRTLERAVAYLERQLIGDWERSDSEEGEVTLTRDDEIITISQLEVR